jgi:hypothetical protein
VTADWSGVRQAEPHAPASLPVHQGVEARDGVAGGNGERDRRARHRRLLTYRVRPRRAGPGHPQGAVRYPDVRTGPARS